MTLRDIGIALRQIDVRTYNEFAMQARAWGAEVPLKNPYEEETEAAPLIEPEVLEKRRKEFFERKRRQHG